MDTSCNRYSERLARRIYKLRTAGFKWETICCKLGVKESSAHKWYHRYLKEIGE